MDQVFKAHLQLGTTPNPHHLHPSSSEYFIIHPVFIFFLPNCPSHRSGFMFFSSAKRPKLREQNPSASIGDIAKQLGAAWKIMTPEQKAPYEEAAKKDRKRYEQEMELFRKGEFVREGVAEEEDEDNDDDEDED